MGTCFSVGIQCNVASGLSTLLDMGDVQGAKASKQHRCTTLDNRSSKVTWDEVEASDVDELM
jgi:hypothetical protein